MRVVMPSPEAKGRFSVSSIRCARAMYTRYIRAGIYVSSIDHATVLTNHDSPSQPAFTTGVTCYHTAVDCDYGWFLVLCYMSLSMMLRCCFLFVILVPVCPLAAKRSESLLYCYSALFPQAIPQVLLELHTHVSCTNSHEN